MTSTRRWLVGAGASAVLLLGVAVPALAQEATSSEQATEQSTEQSSRAENPASGDHDCTNRPSGEAPSDAASSEA